MRAARLSIEAFARDAGRPLQAQVMLILETADGHTIKESLVILQYLDDLYPERPVAQRDP